MRTKPWLVVLSVPAGDLPWALSCDRGPGYPLLFLNVDGPLLPFGGSPPPGPRQVVDSAHLARLRLDTGPRLAGLPCTLVWATTWLEDANAEIAPRLGLPDLPVVIWPEPTAADEREAEWPGLCWKTKTLVNWAGRRPFAWVDDEVTDADRDWVSAHHACCSMMRPDRYSTQHLQMRRTVESLGIRAGSQGASLPSPGSWLSSAPASA